MRWFVRAVKAVVLVAFVYTWAFGCLPAVNSLSEPKESFWFKGPGSDVSIVEARGQALDLLLEIYEVLSREGDVGEFFAPRPGDYFQAERVDQPECPKGMTNERYSLAGASALSGGTELSDRDYELVRGLVAPYGFEEDRSGRLVRPWDGASIDLSVLSVLSVSTGCHRGERFEDWPAGTEAVPEHLRTTGRQRSGTPEPDVWSSEVPVVPVPPSPTGPSPEPSPSPVRGRHRVDADPSPTATPTPTP